MVQALEMEFNYDVSESRMTRIMFGTLRATLAMKQLAELGKINH